MLSLLLRLLLPLRPRLIPGTDTTVMATGLMATTGLMAMDTTTERGLLRLSLRPLLMLLLRLLLIPGMDTMARSHPLHSQFNVRRQPGQILIHKLACLVCST